MLATINHDEFEDQPLPYVGEPHVLIFGMSGWTDQVDSATVDLLVRIGAVRLHKVVSGPDFESHIYVSTKGTEPN